MLMGHVVGWWALDHLSSIFPLAPLFKGNEDLALVLIIVLILTFLRFSSLNVDRFTLSLKLVCTIILCNGILQYLLYILALTQGSLVSLILTLESWYANERQIKLVIVCKTEEISLKYAVKQIVFHVVVVARRQHNGCFNAYNGIKDAWKCVSHLNVSLC